jgi:type IV secretory pathway TrbF-like protein
MGGYQSPITTAKKTFMAVVDVESCVRIADSSLRIDVHERRATTGDDESQTRSDQSRICSNASDPLSDSHGRFAESAVAVLSM